MEDVIIEFGGADDELSDDSFDTLSEDEIEGDRDRGGGTGNDDDDDDNKEEEEERGDGEFPDNEGDLFRGGGSGEFSCALLLC